LRSSSRSSRSSCSPISCSARRNRHRYRHERCGGRARITPVASVALELGGSGGARSRNRAKTSTSGVWRVPRDGRGGRAEVRRQGRVGPYIKKASTRSRRTRSTHPCHAGARWKPDFTDLEVTRAVVYMANAGARTSRSRPLRPPSRRLRQPRPCEGRRAHRRGIYKLACSTCHATGASGAPRIDDAAAWRKRFGDKTRSGAAVRNQGSRGMPSRGGFADLTDPRCCRP